jgi:LytS/YehU family sensor histidine kinase
VFVCDGKSAKAMLIKLSGLLRIVLQHSGSDLIPLHEELKFMREYLDLEKVRVEERLTVDWSIPSETLDLLVPQLILQPLVENAIRHGIASARGHSWIQISSRINGLLELRISNGVGGRKPPGTGLGLRNTEARLRHLYSGEAAFEFSVAKDGTATATLALPVLGSHEPLRPQLQARRVSSEPDPWNTPATFRPLESDERFPGLNDASIDH